MASHAGKWNANRISKIKDLIDSFNSILLAPIHKGDCLNTHIMGIKDIENADKQIPVINISRTSINNNKRLIKIPSHGVFTLKSYDEDMIYAMAALMSAFGHSVYLPKIIKHKQDIEPKTAKGIYYPKNIYNYKKTNLPHSYNLSFIEFSPVIKFSEGHITSVNMNIALDFCELRKQPIL